MASIGEPLLTTNRPIEILGGVGIANITNPTSNIRKYHKTDLHILGLTLKGYLLFLNELVKDGLASIDQPIDYDFSEKGMYVYGKELTTEQEEKYNKLCEKEFGLVWRNGSAMKYSALPEDKLGKEIKGLTELINSVDKK